MGNISGKPKDCILVECNRCKGTGRVRDRSENSFEFDADEPWIYGSKSHKCPRCRGHRKYYIVRRFNY